MRKQLFIGVLGFFATGITLVSAQEYVDKKITDENGSVSLVTFNEKVNRNGLMPNNIFKEVLGLSDKTEMRVANSNKDITGVFLNEKYQMYYEGIMIDGAVYNLHYKNGQLTSMSGETYKTDHLNKTASISAEAALAKAIQSFGAQKYMWDDAESNIDHYQKPSGDLVFVPMQQNDNSWKLFLSYKFDIFSSQPLDRAYVYVDAVSGAILKYDAIIKHAKSRTNILNKEIDLEKINEEAKIENLQNSIDNLSKANALVAGTAATRYSGSRSIETTLSGSNYILNDATRGGGVRTYNLKKSTSITNTEFTDNDNNWTDAEHNNANFDNAALDAHWGVEKTYDYFFEKHGRNSYNGTGGILRSYVHYGNAVENAYWSGSYMLYGDGASTFSPLTAFDVTAHELGHGVCSSTANLTYNRESGAMNEGLSDIWGATVENYAAPEKQNFLIGEDITKIAPGYLRSMSNPKAVGQPDTYRGGNWMPATAAEGCTTPSDTNDQCGVHINSGVLNHWYYILVQGKTGTNDIGKSYSVTGIGFAKAAQIVYKLETTYLTANSTYTIAKDYGIQSAKEIFGVGSPEAIATQDAFYAVGLGTKYNPNPDTVAPTTPLNLVASETTQNSTYLKWNASTDNFALDGYNVYRNGTLIGTTYTNTYHAKGLTANTTYLFKVQAKDEAGNLSAFSNEVSVTTLASGPNHCASQSQMAALMGIRNVKFNTIDNTSMGFTGYEDFTYLSTDIKRGDTHTITITPYWQLTVYPLTYRVYIDYNNNGVFTDTGETALSLAATSANPVSGSFTIPATATLGKLRMRVIASYGTTTSCTTYSYGQTEDYSLNITTALGTAEQVNNHTITIYPNPVKDILNIKSNDNGATDYKIYNAAGQIVTTGKLIDNKIDVNKIPTGNYILELVNKNGETSTQKFIKK